MCHVGSGPTHFEIVHVNHKEKLEFVVPIAGRPILDRLKSHGTTVLVAVFLPVGARVRVTIESLLKPNDWSFHLFVNPLLWPTVLGQHDPSFGSFKLRLDISLLRISDFCAVSREAPVKIRGL